MRSGLLEGVVRALPVVCRSWGWKVGLYWSSHDEMSIMQIRWRNTDVLLPSLTLLAVKSWLKTPAILYTLKEELQNHDVGGVSDT
jgi:hypothetical protein